MGVQLPSEPINRHEQYLAKIAGQAVEIPTEPLTREEAYLDYIAKHGGGGGGGTNDYDDLLNQPKINDVTLKGNKSLSDLGIASASALANKVDKVAGKGLSTNDYSNEDKAIVGGVTAALADKVDKVEGKGLSTNDYDNTEKQKNANNATAITGIKNGTTINDFAGVETVLDGVATALATKQNATDNNLETDAKTIVGAINEHEGDVSSLKSGLTTLDTEVNGDATVYPYADVITILDSIPANLADCSVKIEPVQDLHGYDKPWVGGAGKNKCPLTVDGIKALNSGLTWNGNTAIKGGVPFTILTDSDNNVLGIKALGTSTAQIWYFTVAHITTTETLLFNTGNTYTWDGNKIVCEVTDGTNTYHASTLNGVEVPAGTYDVVIAAQNNAAVDVTFLPMLRATTETDATFAPYTNICPITGHTEVDVTDAPLVDWEHPTVNDASLLTYVNNVLTVYGNNNYRSVTYTLPIAKKGLQRMTLDASTLQTTSGSNGKVDIIDGETAIYESAAFTSNTHLDFTFTTNSDYVKLKMFGTRGGVVYADSGVAYSNITFNGDLISEPIKTYTIVLGDTIYGGTVDFDSGVMTVDRAMLTLDGTEQGWSTDVTSGGKRRFSNAQLPSFGYTSTAKISALSNIFENTTSSDYDLMDDVFILRYINGANRIDIMTEQFADTTELTTFLGTTNMQVLYMLATPTTVQLTPQQIQLLKGTNTITASTGQISVTVNGVSGAIGAVQEQANATDAALAELAEQLPSAPTTDGAYVLTVTVADGTPTYSWESAT